MMAIGHPGVKYVATGCASYAVDLMNKVRKAFAVGGPTFMHTYDPCPKGWDYDPKYSHEVGMLGVDTGVGPSRTHHRGVFPGDFLQAVLDNFLDGESVGLHLPAVITGSLIFDEEF